MALPNYQFFKVTQHDQVGNVVTFPGAIFGDGVLVDSRTGDRVKVASSWEQIPQEQWEAWCDALGLEG